MDYLVSQQKLKKILEDKLANDDLAWGLIFKIDSIGDQYSLTLGEVGEIYDLLDKIIGGEASRDNLLQNLSQRIGVTEEEIREIERLLEKEIFGLLEAKKVLPKKSGEAKKLETLTEELELVKKELIKRGEAV